METNARRWIAALGGLAMIAGSFLVWIELGLASGLTRTGFDLDMGVYLTWDEVNLADSFLTSAGMLTTLLGVLAIVGAVASNPVLMRVAGILGIGAVALLWFSLANTSDMKYGYWVVAAGALLATAGGLLAPKRARTGDAHAAPAV